MGTIFPKGKNLFLLVSNTNKSFEMYKSQMKCMKIFGICESLENEVLSIIPHPPPKYTKAGELVFN